MMRPKMISLFVLTTAFAGGLALVSMTDTATAAPVTPDLCVGTGIQFGGGGGGCVYTGPDVPALNVDVCWDGTTARIKGSSACPGKERHYFAKYGEVVDPFTGEIVAYAPLMNACNVVPCSPSDIDSQQLVDGTACCDANAEDCTMVPANGICLEGEITWCEELEDKGDGTVECHE